MASDNTYRFSIQRSIKNNRRLPANGKPNRSNNIPPITPTQKSLILNMSDFFLITVSSSWFMKSTAKTGFMIKATTKEAARVKMSIVGRYIMNFPMIPGQKSNGKKGASVVTVPANTGINTSPAAIRAAMPVGMRPFPCIKMRWVFSITTMASSTIIPSPNNSANSTIKLRVTCEPTIRSAAGRNTNATNILSGTDNATKKAFTTPMKNINTISTNTKPMIIEFTSSLKEDRVFILWSPVITTFKSFGKTSAWVASTISFTPSLLSIRFSPFRLIMLRVTTFFPFSRAKLSLSFVVSIMVAISFK